MNSVELRETDHQKLREHIVALRRELVGLRLKHATGELDNTANLRKTKRELARTLTIAGERGIDSNIENGA